ncbi:MAG: PTS sugar transporter subunit IIA [Candidatus Omnitrophota bacterium]|nr:PTS sugar transporter subunit IIA [Candidatus Omnitrophota bacterium]
MKENSVLTTQELSKYLKLNEKTVLKMAQSGKLPGFKIANQWRFYLSAVDEYLQDKVAKFSRYDFGKFIRTTDLMPLSRLIDENTIELKLQADNQENVLRELAKISYTAGIAISSEEVFRQLKKREEMLSTGIGGGVAIPHSRNPNDELFKMPGVIIARSVKGIDFFSATGEKVHLFFMTCATDVVLHLKLLSKIAKLFKDKQIFQKFMHVKSKQEVMRILLNAEKMSI